MIDEVWKRNEMDSPCVKICIIHNKEKICIGCYRTISEIANWSHYTHKKREIILSNLKMRSEKLLPKRRGGRKQHLKNQI